MSLGPTGFVSHMNPGFVGGRVHNLEPVTTTNQPTLSVTTNVLWYSRLIHYQLTINLPLGINWPTRQRTDEEVRSTDDARRGTTDLGMRHTWQKVVYARNYETHFFRHKPKTTMMQDAG